MCPVIHFFFTWTVQQIFFLFGIASMTWYGNSSYCKYDQCKKNEYVSLLIEFWVREMRRV